MNQRFFCPKIFFELGDEIEGKRLEPVFKAGEDLVGKLNADGRSSLRWWVKLEEEEFKDLDMFRNVVLVDLNLDEIRCMKLASWKEDFEGRLDSLGISSLEVLNEKECDITKNADECEDGNFSLSEVGGSLNRGDFLQALPIISEDWMNLKRIKVFMKNLGHFFLEDVLYFPIF